MSEFKCKLCGGSIELTDVKGIGVCDSCGTKQTISIIDDEKKMNMLDRANHFRIENEFDKAYAIYEQLLDDASSDSELYWLLVLCRYGITYVDDPKTNKKIPTVNRMQSKSILKDPDYIMAIEKATEKQKALYLEEATYIDKIQQRILDITKNEKPYDVFICYKETDESGKRTKDSVLANDLYYELINEGFKVFFSKITLEDKLGTEYEPYIFSALQSAKVMVVIGTDPKYFNAVWVKNEWSRFLSLIEQGEKKIIIPAFKDMDPYDLPEEFASLQAQDMSKLGFMQDLIRGIKKILSNSSSTITDVSKTDKSEMNDTTKALLKRIKIFIEDGNWISANEYCERVLDIDAENANVYLYKILIDTKSTSLEALGNTQTYFDNNENYKKVIKYGDDEIKTKVNKIQQKCLKNIIEQFIKNDDYINAFEGINTGIEDENIKNELIKLAKKGAYEYAIILKDNWNFSEAKSLFELASGYLNANQMAEECANKLKKEENISAGIQSVVGGVTTFWIWCKRIFAIMCIICVIWLFFMCSHR